MNYIYNTTYVERETLNKSIAQTTQKTETITIMEHEIQNGPNRHEDEYGI